MAFHWVFFLKKRNPILENDVITHFYLLGCNRVKIKEWMSHFGHCQVLCPQLTLLDPLNQFYELGTKKVDIDPNFDNPENTNKTVMTLTLIPIYHRNFSLPTGKIIKTVFCLKLLKFLKFA